MWASGPADPSTLSKPFPKQSTGPGSHQGDGSECWVPKPNLGFQVLTSEAGILAKICTLLNCAALLNLITAWALLTPWLAQPFWPHSFSIPKMCFASHQCAPSTPRQPRSVSILARSFSPPHRPCQALAWRDWDIHQQTIVKSSQLKSCWFSSLIPMSRRGIFHLFQPDSSSQHIFLFPGSKPHGLSADLTTCPRWRKRRLSWTMEPSSQQSRYLNISPLKHTLLRKDF